METVTLRSEDFKTVHNTLCELRSIVGDMERSLIKVERLEAVIQRFEQGLADAYRQDNEAFDRKHDCYSLAQQANKFRTLWSIYEVEDLEAQHPFQGALQVAYRDHWGEEGAVFEEIKTEGQGHGTWLDLWAAADRCIRRSGDDHHCFIEAFTPNPENPQQLMLQTGS